MSVLTHFVLWSLGLACAETQTSEAERQCLSRHAVGRRRLVEIGVWHGVTTCCLRRSMAPDGLLFCVPYPAGRLGFSAPRLVASSEVRRVRNGSVQWIRKTGLQAGRDYAAGNMPPVDFLFIDGDHGYNGLRDDWEASSGLVEPDGVVALHDSRSSPERSIDDAGRAIYTRQVILRDDRFRLAEAVDTLSVLLKLH